MTAPAELIRQGRFAEALPELERQQQQRPADGGIAMQRFVALLRLGRSAEAEAALAAALTAGATQPALRYNLALLRTQAGRYAEALPVLDGMPEDDADALGLRGLVLQQLGHHEQAHAALTRVTELRPDYAMGYHNLGVHLAEHAAPGEAIDAFRQALALAPEQPASRLGLAAALKAHGDVHGSEMALRELLTLHPDHADAHASLGVCLLARAAFAEAENAFGHALRLQPANQNALAGMALSWAALDKQAEYDWLMDYGNLLRIASLPVPEGYADLAAFNRALVEEVLADPSLLRDPHGRTTRSGRQSTDLRLHTGPAVRTLVATLESAFQAYHDGIPEALRQGGHPVARGAPQRWRMSIWSTVLDQAGHQLPHIHPSGWLSGVYYVQTGSDDDDSGAGCIEFGAPPEDVGGEANVPCPVARHRPQAGELILFPSYFYHRTVPHAGGAPRISIAFDCMPE
jgi:Flp pilus assembly protein TadD